MTADVRFQDGIVTSVYDMKLTGYIYDFYDFNIGKLNGYCGDYFDYKCTDFNTDGGWLQIGYDGNNRKKGGVFITKVPFTVYMHERCDLGVCTYWSGLKFSQETDFQ